MAKDLQKILSKGLQGGLTLAEDVKCDMCHKIIPKGTIVSIDHEDTDPLQGEVCFARAFKNYNIIMPFTLHKFYCASCNRKYNKGYKIVRDIIIGIFVVVMIIVILAVIFLRE